MGPEWKPGWWWGVSARGWQHAAGVDAAPDGPEMSALGASARGTGGCPGACAVRVICPHVAVIPGGVWRHLVEFFERSAVLLRCRIGVFGRWSLLVGF